MKSLEFREQLADKFGREIDFPLQVDVDEYGNVTGARYESEWQTGGTEPVLNDAGEIVDYAQNYETHKLTKAEISKLDKAIESIMET